MDRLDSSIEKMLATPFCPTCATGFEPHHYDIYEDQACCPTCGTEYRVPADYRLEHPEDYLEPGVANTPETVAIVRFRIEAKRIAEETMLNTIGGSYEMYERRFTETVQSYIDKLDPTLHDEAITIACRHGYLDDPEILGAGFGPGLCSLTGIEDHCCPCNRHS